MIVIRNLVYGFSNIMIAGEFTAGFKLYSRFYSLLFLIFDFQLTGELTVIDAK